MSVLDLLRAQCASLPRATVYTLMLALPRWPSRLLRSPLQAVSFVNSKVFQWLCCDSEKLVG